MIDNVVRYSAMVLVAIVVAIGIAFGLTRFGQTVAAELPSLQMPDLPSLPEVIQTVKEPEPYHDLSPGMIQSIQAMASLTTIEYTEYTTVEKGTDSSWLDWARGDTIIMLAVADIGAGVALDGLTVESFTVEPNSGIVQLRLPPATIHYSSLDNNATTVYNRKTGLFTHGDSQLESQARRIAEDHLLQKALDAGILADAERNAMTVIRNFLLSVGYTDVIVLPPPLVQLPVSSVAP